jgi:hypothetical protein
MCGSVDIVVGRRRLLSNPVFVWGYAKVLFASLTTGTDE